MPNWILISAAIFISVIVIGYFIIKKYFNKDAIAQRQLNKYLRKNFSSDEIGLFYERYIGHLYESEGYDVVYNGAISGYDDLGRDLIVSSEDEIFVVQTKCWSKSKKIQEKYIFQLFGSLVHYRRTQPRKFIPTKAVFVTTAQFSIAAVKAAEILGVRLRVENLNRLYPMIKCCKTKEGNKFYYLPFDDEYDRLQVDLHRDEYFVFSVKEALEKGFARFSNEQKKWAS